MEQTVKLNAHNKQEYPPMHTVEHILNQAMIRLFGCPRSLNTHIERKKSKCDYVLSAAPTDAQIAEIEAEVNRVIESDLPVTESFMSRADAAAVVDLRKLPESVSQTLRIIQVGDYDICACIGSHVSCTSEIPGRFKIISSDYHSPIWRIRFRLE